MSLLEHEARGGKLYELRAAIPRQPFVAIDPDADGSALLFPEKHAEYAQSPSCIFFNLRTNAVEVAKAALEDGVRLFVVEAQYVGFNRMTPIRLARRAMVIPAVAYGMLASMRGADPSVTVLHVPPATWQAYVRRGYGAQVKREEGKRYVLEYAEREAPEMFQAEWTKSARETVADAFGLSEWVRDVLWSNKGARVKF